MGPETSTGFYGDGGAETFVSIVLVIFAIAHFGSGLCGMLLKRIPAPGLDKLLDTTEYQATDGSGVKKSSVNVTEWGIRQTTIGVMLILSMIWGTKETYLVAFGGIC